MPLTYDLNQCDGDTKSNSNYHSYFKFSNVYLSHLSSTRQEHEILILTDCSTSAYCWRPQKSMTVNTALVIGSTFIFETNAIPPRFLLTMGGTAVA